MIILKQFYWCEGIKRSVVKYFRDNWKRGIVDIEYR